ncbi:MAG: hypothetical protein R2713_20475 [Ilumatobacteraceae bacterium]
MRARSSDGPGASGETGELRSSLSRDPADATLGPAAADAVSAFGLDLYRLLAADRPDDNLVLSPASIALALRWRLPARPAPPSTR